MTTHVAATEERSLPSPQFKGELLQRVYRIWLFRKLAPVLIGEIIGLSLILYVVGRLVFVQRVIENMLTVFFLNPPRVVPFLVSAFLNSSTTTKLFTLFAAVLIALVIRHLTQGILRLVLVKKDFFGKTPLHGTDDHLH